MAFSICRRGRRAIRQGAVIDQGSPVERRSFSIFSAGAGGCKTQEAAWVRICEPSRGVRAVPMTACHGGKDDQLAEQEGGGNPVGGTVRRLDASAHLKDHHRKRRKPAPGEGMA